MKEKKNGKLIVFSFDAMNSIDFDMIKDLDLFKDFMDNGAYVRSVKTIYPSLTYPAHTSIMTSCYPDKHGIFNNEIPNEKDLFKPDWFWFKKDIKVKTVYDYLEEYGYKNSAFFFPVMAGEKRGYVVPEIFDPKNGHHAKAMIKNCPIGLMPYLAKHKAKIDGLKQPALDDFLFNVAYDVYKAKKPDTAFIHFTELDTRRHNDGLDGDHVLDSYMSMCSKVEKFIDLTKRMGIYDETTFVILGDHGGANTMNDISLNKLFLDHHLLEVDGDGIKNATCYALDCGGSAEIFINNPREEGTVVDLLISLREQGFIKEIFNKEEAKNKFNLAGGFSYVVEAADNYQFVTPIYDEVITKWDDTKPDHKLNHGQMPDNPLLKTMLFMKGRGIKKGAMLEQCNIVDEGCTFLQLFNIDMPNVDGRILKELLE